jgi:hypothetical protein
VGRTPPIVSSRLLVIHDKPRTTQLNGRVHLRIAPLQKKRDVSIMQDQSKECSSITQPTPALRDPPPRQSTIERRSEKRNGVKRASFSFTNNRVHHRKQALAASDQRKVLPGRSPNFRPARNLARSTRHHHHPAIFS